MILKIKQSYKVKGTKGLQGHVLNNVTIKCGCMLKLF